MPGVDQGREEQHGFKAFAHYRQEGEQHQTKQVAAVDGGIDAPSWPHLGFGLLLHPDRHVGEYQSGENEIPAISKWL